MSVFNPGTIFIPDEIAANQGCLISAIDGSIIDGAVSVAQSNEGGALINSGTFCIADVNVGPPLNFKIYNKTFVLLATTATFSVKTAVPITSNGTTKFYLVSQAGLTNNFVTIDAVTGSTLVTDTVPDGDDVYAMAVNPAGTILYWVDVGGIGIHRWDLINRLPLPDLLVNFGDGSAMWGRDLIYVPNAPGGGDALALINVDMTLTHYSFRRYSVATAVLQQEVALPDNSSNGDIPRMSLDLGAPSVAIWMRIFPTPKPPTLSTFTQLSLVDGSTLTTFTVPTSSSGAPNTVPDSCPFFGYSNNIPPPSKRPGCQGFGPGL